MNHPTPLFVGITGHRVFAEIDSVERGVNEALDGLRHRFPGRLLTVLSSLAEGADQLVARLAMERDGARLIVVLPLSQDDYLRDFVSEQSRREFRALFERSFEIVGPLPAPSRDEAYAQAGRIVLDRSDVILAIWDGQPSQGHGGTADVVALARERRLPLIWIRVQSRRAAIEPTPRRVEQEPIIWERL